MPRSRDIHFACAMKLAGRGVVKLSGLVEVLISAHPSRDENFPVRQKSCCLPRTRFEHRRSWRDRTEMGNWDGDCSKCRGCNGKRDGGKSNQKQAGWVHGILLKK